ncbi:class I SAM-dependent methyltransferase [Pleomorphovibrio marinus]|uniref:class I SAM-dependent methyltransferase n=1 Tax=Pleomorphovibrio marinus TaxID=2164132 RepID=UPI000E0BB1B3|nr:class I SAM-dependent methyltransferase [Pleomorphovibrio marinus]
MSNKTINTWKTFGKKDPYYGVLSDEKYRMNNLTDKGIEDFFHTGKEYTEETLKRISQYHNADLSEASILDFGCGLGRLTIPFSKITSGSVVGIDISPDILEKARLHAKELAAENIEYILFDGKMLPEVGQFDFINSYIVLQHIEKNIGFSLIKQLLDRVKVGGIIQLHITYGNALPKFKYLHYYFRSKNILYNTVYSILKNRSLEIEPIMQMNNYDPKDMFKLITKYSSSVHIVFTDHGGFLGASYLLRREY